MPSHDQRTRGRRSGQRGLEAVVHTIGPPGRGDHHHQLDDLLLAEVRGQRVEIARLDVAGMARQQVGEAQQRLLLRAEDFCVPPARLLQRRDLRVAQPVPLTRSGVAARSVGAPVHDRHAQSFSVTGSALSAHSAA